MSLLLIATAIPLGAQEPTRDPGEQESRRSWTVGGYLQDTGPLRVRERFLPGTGFLAFDPVSPVALEAGKWQLDAILTVSNNWAQSRLVENSLEDRDRRRPVTLEDFRGWAAEGDGVYHVDGEHWALGLAARRGLGRGLELEVLVPVHRFEGGGLDSVIETFHDSFSLTQAGRLGATKDRFQIYFGDGELEIYQDQEPGWALGDLVVGLKVGLLDHGGPWAVSVQPLVKLPTGDDDTFASSGSFDYGAQLLVARYFRRSSLHLSSGAIRLGEYELFALDDQTVFSGMLGYEHALFRTWAIVAQVTVSQSPFADIPLDNLEDEVYQWTAGIKKEIRRSVLFLGLTENTRNRDNSPDIGFHFGWTRTFP